MSMLMRTIDVAAANGESRIVIGPGLLQQLGSLLTERWPRAGAAWLISDATVVRHHGTTAAEALRQAGLRVHEYAVPAGEASKSLAEVARLYDWQLAGGIARGDVIVALGGGVVGDLAGFVAATILRGVPLVQAPTTLLAMVDSSVGGKTGVNHAAGKNLIGAFYQPPLVVIDPSLLGTLPQRERASGWAEVIKYGMIEASVPTHEANGASLIDWLDREADALLALDEPATSEVIYRCVDLKARTVQADPTEQGIRAILNYGHTAGHAVEAASGYGALLHGEAVAIGMRVAATIGVATGRIEPAVLARQQAVVQRFALPTSAPGLTPAALWPYMRLDKKAEAGALRWVLPTSLGHVDIVRGVDETIVDAALAQITTAAGA